MHKCILLSSISYLFFILFVFPCNAQSKKHKRKNKKEISVINKPNDTSSDCDELYWKYVYNPSRLKVFDKCKIVTGVIEESSADEDGDQHMLLKLDKGQGDLLTKKNIKKNRVTL